MDIITIKKSGKARQLIIVGALLVFALHCALVFKHFPVSSVLNHNPLCSGDLGWHFPSALEGDQFLGKQGRVWGYSPTYMAGYPWGLWNSFSKRGYEYATTILPGASVETAFYLWLVACVLAAPLLIAASGRIIGLSWADAALGLIVAVIIFQFENVVSYFWTFGNVVFPLGSALALLFSAFVYRCCVSRGWVFAVVGGAILGLLFWLHPLCLVPAGWGACCVLLYNWRRFSDWQVWVRIAAVLVIGLLIAMPWMKPLLMFLDMRIQTHEGLPSGLVYGVMDFLSDRAYGHPFDYRSVFHILMVTALLGGWWAGRHQISGIAAFCVVVGCLLFSTYGFPYLPFLKNMQPYRFYVSAVVFAIFPAVFGFKKLWLLARETNIAGRVLCLILAIVLLPTLTPSVIDVIKRRPAYGLTEQQKACFAWVGRQVADGRVLCQDPVLGSMLPYYTKREVIGGFLSNESPLLQSWTSFGPRGVFGLATQKVPFSCEDWKAYVELYNIAYIVTVGVDVSVELGRLSGQYEKASQFGNLCVFKVLGDRSYVWGAKGAGINVQAGPNRIIVEHAPHGNFVLKYHYLRSMTSSVGTSLRPQRLLKDPAPFIEIDNPGGLDRIEIVNAY